jgi:uncharacterized protein YdgA (DUF945 family)
MAGNHYLINDLVYKTELVKSLQGLWPGKFLGKLDKVTIENQADNFKVTILGMTTGGMMQVEGDMADFSGNLHIEKLIFNDKQYGPIDYANSLKNIESRVVKSILDFSHKLKTGEQIQPTMYLQNLMALVPELLKSRPEFTIDHLQVHTDEGDIQAQLSFAIGGQGASDINNLPQIIQSIVAKAVIMLPKPILRDILTYQYTKEAKQAPQPVAATPPTAPLSDQALLTQQVDQKVNDTLSKWLKDATLVEKGESYTSQLDIDKGNIMLNGHALVLPQQHTVAPPIP